MNKKIVILEDNEDRAIAMRRCLEDRFCEFEASFFDEAAAMIDCLRTHLPGTILICLDHDLELKPGADGRPIDPGTGRDVADFLACQTPVCPVVIHTTNSAAGVGMEMALQEAGWQTQRVSPYGDLEWIPAEWFRAIRRAVVGPKKGRQRLRRSGDRP
jgi:hypothetical protein